MAKMHAGILALIFKLGPKLLSVGGKLIKGLKIGKVGLAATSMASYALLFSWQFAVLIMALLFVHEYGHILGMKRCGVKTKGIYFLPFIGAAAVCDEAFPSRKSEVYIALAGPIVGLAFSLLVAIAYLFTGSALLGAAAGWMAMVNLFNMLPINPLDGGRVVKSLAFSVHGKLGIAVMALGLVAACFLATKVGLLLFMFLLIVGGLELFFETLHRRRLRKQLAELKAERTRLDGQPTDGEVKIMQTLTKTMPYGPAEIEDLRKEYELEPEQALKMLEELRPLRIKANEERQKAVEAQLAQFEKPALTKGEMALTVLLYVAVAGLLWGLMLMLNHIPAAALTQEFFAS